MYITLDKKDSQRIAEEIAKFDDGKHSAFVEIDEIEFEVVFYIERTEYREEDTGAWITDYCWVEVKKIMSGSTEISYDKGEIERLAMCLMME